MTLITHIAEAIKDGVSDNDLDVIIQEFIGPDGDVPAWRIERYADLRRWAYPPMEDYLDAEVKGDAEQKADYVAACLSVKERFPKTSAI